MPLVRQGAVAEHEAWGTILAPSEVQSLQGIGDRTEGAEEMSVNEKDREEALLDLEREAWDIYMLMEFDDMGELCSARKSAEWIEKRDDRIRSEAVKAERETLIEKVRGLKIGICHVMNGPREEWYDRKDVSLDDVLSILSDDQEPAFCEWAFGGYLWSASCGATWEFPEGSPEDNKFRYCPRCGRHVKEADRG
jgi:hypothetical protein